MKRVAVTARLVIWHWSSTLFFVLLYSLQYTLMLSLEAVDPGDSLSMLLIYHAYLARCPSESVLAGVKGQRHTVATGQR